MRMLTARAAERTCAKVRPSARVPMARRSPRASAAISRIIAMFTGSPRRKCARGGATPGSVVVERAADRASVGGRQGLGLRDLHGLPVAAQRALAGLGHQDGGLALGARVALAHLVR